MVSDIHIGYPLILKQSKGMRKHGLTNNMKGFCNNLVVIDGEGKYVMFQPEGLHHFFWISADRFVVDEERLKEMEGIDETGD